MEVVNECSQLLSNWEVYEMLKQQQLKKGKRKPSKDLQNLSTITYEGIKYLEKTPASHQSPQIIHDFLSAVQPFQLTKAEKLQLLNHRPTSAVEIQLLVEESEERLTEEQIDQLLQIIADILPGPPEEEVMEEEES